MANYRLPGQLVIYKNILVRQYKPDVRTINWSECTDDIRNIALRYGWLHNAAVTRTLVVV